MGQIMAEPRFIIEEVSDPNEIARCRAQDEQHRRNNEWLQAHWADVLPQARGKFLAVAGQEPFIADTPEEAWAWVDATHPEDSGAIVHYIISQRHNEILLLAPRHHYRIERD
jgi:hypothetical protein